MGRLHFSDQKEENNLADKNLKARIVNKNGTSAEWEKATSFVPKKGELILYTDLNKIKIGDGVTKVNDLPFSNDDKVSKAGDTITGDLQIKGDYSLDLLRQNPTRIASISAEGISVKNYFKLGYVTDTLYNGWYSIILDGDGIAFSEGNPYNRAPTIVKGIKTPVSDNDAANKRYVDDSIPTTQIEELSSAVAKAEPFVVEATMTTSNEISVNKTFAEIKTASDAGKLCYARITNSGIIVPLVTFDLRVDKKVAVFSSSNLSISHFNTVSLLIAEDNSVSTETFSSQSLIEATGLLKGSGNGTITAAVAGTDYAAADHTHDTYTATEIDAMWNAVTIS